MSKSYRCVYRLFECTLVARSLFHMPRICPMAACSVVVLVGARVVGRVGVFGFEKCSATTVNGWDHELDATLPSAAACSKRRPGELWKL